MQRRQFIKGGGGLLAAGTAGLAGCTDILGGDDGTQTGSVSDITSWLPAPREISTDLENYGFDASAPAALASVYDDPRWESQVAPNPQFGSPKADDVDYSISASTSTVEEQYDFQVYSGSFDGEWIGTTIRTNDNWRRERAFEDYTIFGRQNNDDINSTVVAVSDSGMLEVTHVDQSGDPSANAARFAELLVDTNGGNLPRYTEQNEGFQAVADGLPDGHQLNGRTFEETPETNAETGQFRGQIGQGRSRTLSGDTVEITNVLVFFNENDIRERDIEIYVEESGQFSNYLGRPDININGNTVTISGETRL